MKSFERPQLYKLISELTSLKKSLNESRVDYLTRADDMNYNLTLGNEGKSEKMFISIIVNGLPKEYESFTTLVKLSKKEKSLEEIQRDLTNLDNENVQKKSESIFYTKERKCFKCQKVGHISKDCLLKKANTEQTRGQPIK